MTTAYIIAALSAVVLGLIGYLKVKTAQNKVLQTNNDSLKDVADKSAQTVETLQKVATKVARAQEAREEKHKKEQTEIEVQRRRNHFESEGF